MTEDAVVSTKGAAPALWTIRVVYMLHRSITKAIEHFIDILQADKLELVLQVFK
jgi:hypothetical protein